jgi:outer membrane protein OmpA-like peptidoglycan-associated protein/Tol biopolymer transport system component
MLLRVLILFCFLTYLSSAHAQQTQVTTVPLDSMVYYNNTKKPEISDAKLIEYAASIQADGKVMIVQTNVIGHEGRWRLFEYKMDKDRKWGMPKALDSIDANVDSTSLVGGPSISFDGNTMYFFMNNDIYYSDRQRYGWSKPYNIGAPINTREYEGFPSVSADGKTLYYVGQNFQGPKTKELRKKDTFCYCILKSVKGTDGKWGKPEKLPAPINQDCEKAPRIMADGKTLIFSSNRLGGKGGYDMYQSQLTDLGTWTIPVPLTFVNTEQDDLSPSIAAQGDLMFYTNNAKDIYSVEIPKRLRQFKNNILQGYVTDMDSHQGLGVEIFVYDALTSETVMHLENNPDDGRFTVVLPIGRSFNIEFKTPGYSSYTYPMDLSKVKEYREIEHNIELFKTVRLTVTVNDKEIFEPLPAEIKVRVKGKNEFLKDLRNNPRTGRVMIELPLGTDYELIVGSQSFKGAIMDFNTTGLIIYRDFEKFVELVPEKTNVMINVADLQNNSKVNSKILLRNKNRDEVIEVTGNQMVALRSGDRYEIEVTSDQGYAFDSRVLDVQGGQTAVDFKLTKLELNAKLVLKDINFESNSSKLSDVSFTELDRVIKLLSENPTLRVEIAAHTDDIGSDVYNQVLSQKRAQSVVDFLKQNKISEGRFVALGYGEKAAKVPNISEENRLVNRRVELKIIGI